MRLSETRCKVIYASLLALLLMLAGLGLTTSRSLERIDLVLYDLMLPLHAGKMSDQVVVIAIDDNSLQQLGRWPWSRRVHAELIDRLTDLGAGVVGIDILYADTQDNDPGADIALARAIERNGRVVLTVAPVLQTPESLISEILPLPDLAISAAAIGHVDVELDQDGLCRRLFLYSGVGDARWPALTLAMLQFNDAAPFVTGLDNDNAFQLQNTEHWVRRHSMMIPFASKGASPAMLSWVDVLEGRVEASAVRDKYVLIGATATGLGDALATPAAKAHERMPGVVFNAHILNGLLQGEGINELSTLNRSLLTTALILAIVLTVIALPLRLGLLLSLAEVGGVLSLTLILLFGWQLWFPPAVTIVIAISAWPLWNLWQLGLDARLRKQLLQQLGHQETHHAASGLPNNGMLENRLHLLTQNQDTTSNTAGLMVIHFEWPGSASTTLGRPIGDSLLQIIADRLRTAISGDNFIAHLNGDDFAVLVTGLSDEALVRQAAATLLERLRQPLELEGEYLLLAPQVGVSIWPLDGLNNAVDLLRNAYTAMFKSRIDDSGSLCIYSADIGQQLQVRSQLEQALIHALERGEFEVYYQPQVLADSGEIVGVEALLRWHNPKLGWVSPGLFIPVAEHVGLINDIGYWVLSTACQQLQEWRRAGLQPLRLAVNVSPVQFTDPALESSIIRVVDQTGINPSDLELEITEGSLMWDMDRAITVMKRIKDKGIILAIDDFGTGYSSLSNLRHYPLDRLKIDQSFTLEVGRNADATEITLTILAMGKRLGLNVIAEGVETQEQANFLRQHGCDEFQGYLFSRPLPADQIAQLLRDNADLKEPMHSEVD